MYFGDGLATTLAAGFGGGAFVFEELVEWDLEGGGGEGCLFGDGEAAACRLDVDCKTSNRIDTDTRSVVTNTKHKLMRETVKQM